MTRRFEETTRTVYKWFKERYDVDPEKYHDRDLALIDLQDIIAPGVAARYSEQHSKEYHDSLSPAEQVRRGRRNKMIQIITSLYRGGHLEQKIIDGKTFLRINADKLESHDQIAASSVPSTSSVVSTQVVTQAPVSLTPIEPIQLHILSKSDIANKFEITDIVVDGQPKIRVKYGNLVFELSSSAADHLCDRIGAQLIYARGSFASRNAQTP
jgi:hypothetical protein